MRDIDLYKGDRSTVIFLRLAAYLFTRKMELMEATWHEVNFETGRWVIPAGRIKQRSYDLIVDLPIQAQELMQELRDLANGSKYLFPRSYDKDKHMDKTTPLQALYKMGYKGEMCVHGFRAMAATQLKALGHQESFIDRQLSHINGSKTHSAYFREQHLEDLPERKIMLQDWANHLDLIKVQTLTRI
jgi:integrase